MTFESEFSNWAVVSYKDDTGLGRMAQDAKRTLGIGFQVVVPSQRLHTKEAEAGDFQLAGDGKASTSELREFLSERDGLLVLEKADWTADLLPIARELGLTIVAVPMWEWFRADDPLWRLCDLFVCPNRKCLEVVTAAGFRNAVHLPWPLDLERLPHRVIKGKARTFIHNAGLVDADDRKGTRDVIKAFQGASYTEARLIVRMQKAADVRATDDRIEVRIGNVAEVSQLWNEGDVAVQPSKMEGIGFTILEPICAGVPVITLDAAPMNEYAAEMLVKPQWFKRKAFASQWNSQAHLRLPSQRHLVKAIEYAAGIDLEGINRRQRAWAEEMFDAEKLRESWTQAVKAAGKRTVMAW